MSPDRREALLVEYREVCQNFRLLTDIRFRLLALVPAAAAIISVLKRDEASHDMLPVALLGLVATLGIATYNKRNDQLYDALVGRAAALERSLGLQDGAFTTRPNPWLQYCVLGTTWRIDHRRGVGTIYFATIVLWIYLVIAAMLGEFIGNKVPRLSQDWFPDDLSPTLASRVLAAASAILLVWLGASILRRQEQRRSDQVRSDAIAALEILNLRERELSCKIRSQVPGSGSALGKSLDQLILASLRECIPFLEACARMLGSANKKGIGTVKARVWFYSSIRSDALRYYVPDASGAWRSAFLLALIVDLPPAWLVDVWANRRKTSATDGRRPELAPEDV